MPVTTKLKVADPAAANRAYAGCSNVLKMLSTSLPAATPVGAQILGALQQYLQETQALLDMGSCRGALESVDAALYVLRSNVFASAIQPDRGDMLMRAIRDGVRTPLLPSNNWLFKNVAPDPDIKKKCPEFVGWTPGSWVQGDDQQHPAPRPDKNWDEGVRHIEKINAILVFLRKYNIHFVGSQPVLDQPQGAAGKPDDQAWISAARELCKKIREIDKGGECYGVRVRIDGHDLDINVKTGDVGSTVPTQNPATPNTVNVILGSDQAAKNAGANAAAEFPPDSTKPEAGGIVITGPGYVGQNPNARGRSLMVRENGDAQPDPTKKEGGSWQIINAY